MVGVEVLEDPLPGVQHDERVGPQYLKRREKAQLLSGL